MTPTNNQKLDGRDNIPPFHRIPIRRGHWNYLALLSQERARAGEEKGELIAPLDAEIWTVISETLNLGGTILQIFSQQDRHRAKIDRLLREVASLTEELAVMQGTVEWLGDLGRSPYKPLYPSGLKDAEIIKLKRKLTS